LEKIFLVLAIITVIISIITIFFSEQLMEGSEWKNLVYVNCVFLMIIGPYVYYQRKKLTDIANLKETQEKIQKDVDKLSHQNKRLKQTVEELSNTIDRLEKAEKAFDAVTQSQAQSVDAFEGQVKENRDILQLMQKNLKANVLQNLLSVVIRADSDNGGTIDPDEYDEVVKRIRTINGIEVPESRFKEALEESNGSLYAVMDIIKDILNEQFSVSTAVEPKAENET